MTSAPTTSEGAPVISLERTVQTDSIAVVWMPVQDASPSVIGYDLYVNGAKFGSRVRENNFVRYLACALLQVMSEVKSQM